jgi:hypothetical protein
MFRKGLLISPRHVQCRTCVNFVGREDRHERRISDRSCAAGLDGHPATLECESFVPLATMAGRAGARADAARRTTPGGVGP